MDTVRIADFGGHVGQEVHIQGWLHNKRSSGKLQFLIVRDGSGFAQMVMSKAAVTPEAWTAAEAMGQESSLTLTGKVKEDKRAPGGYEVDVTSLTVVQSARDFPITPKEHGTAFLMENRHLWLRSQRQHAVIRIRHAVVKAVRDYLDGQGFTLVDTPIFTPAACEGTTTLFAVPYFDEGTAYLTQSGQLYNEATAAAHGKVYCFGPTFRAEKSKTRRHLTEFWMVEPEMAFAHLQDALAVAEGMIVSVVAAVLATRQEELKTLERDVAKLENVKSPFPWLHYDDAIKLIQEKGSATPWGSDFGGTDETVIAEAYDRPVVVHRFPDQGLLHGARPGAAGAHAFGRHPGPGGLRRDRRRRRAHVERRPAPAAHPRAPAPGGGLPLVRGPAPLRQRAPRRLRHGHRAPGHLDLRPGAPAGDDRVPADALSDLSVGRLLHFHRNRSPPQGGLGRATPVRCANAVFLKWLTPRCCHRTPSPLTAGPHGAGSLGAPLRCAGTSTRPGPDQPASADQRWA
jgi:asparaginyl-tRNA synthetase